jgi:hypothetical protein
MLERLGLDEVAGPPQVVIEIEMPHVEVVHLLGRHGIHHRFVEMNQKKVFHVGEDNRVAA